MPEEEFDQTLALNLKGTFFASQAAGRVMMRQKGGCIVNMSSQAGFVALPTESVYCLSKAAIAHLTKCLAIEWGTYNIRVNAVAPRLFLLPAQRGRWPTPPFAPTPSSGLRRCTELASPQRSPGRSSSSRRQQGHSLPATQSSSTAAGRRGDLPSRRTPDLNGYASKDQLSACRIEAVRHIIMYVIPAGAIVLIRCNLLRYKASLPGARPGGCPGPLSRMLGG